MNRMDRLLGIVIELQRKGSQRAVDLAERFETSVQVGAQLGLGRRSNGAGSVSFTGEKRDRKNVAEILTYCCQ